jgi:hypothetical protein
MNWSARYEKPIPAGRKKIATLQDAANYILQLKEPDDLWKKASRRARLAGADRPHGFHERAAPRRATDADARSEGWPHLLAKIRPPVRSPRGH